MLTEGQMALQWLSRVDEQPESVRLVVCVGCYLHPRWCQRWRNWLVGQASRNVSAKRQRPSMDQLPALRLDGIGICANRVSYQR